MDATEVPSWGNGRDYELDQRVALRMSDQDSRNFIDDAVANRLGQHRAIAYSDEGGTREKFRPYSVPSDAWLQRVSESLRKRAKATRAADR